MNGHYSVPVQRPEYYTVMPVCEPFQSSYMYPATDQNVYPVHEVACNGFYKRIATKLPQQMYRSQGKCMQQFVKGDCVLQDPAILESGTTTTPTK